MRDIHRAGLRLPVNNLLLTGCDDEAEAESVADRYDDLFGFTKKVGNSSIFAGSVMDGEADKKQTIEMILREVERLSADESARNAMKECLAGITDGRGAVRIAKALASHDYT